MRLPEGNPCAVFTCETMDAYDVKITCLSGRLVVFSGGSVAFSGGLVAISGGTVAFSGGLHSWEDGLIDHRVECYRCQTTVAEQA